MNFISVILIYEDVGDVKNKTITTFSLFLLQTQPGWIATHEEGGIRI